MIAKRIAAPRWRLLTFGCAPFRLAAFLLWAWAMAAPARGAATQAYRVELAATGEASMDSTLRVSSDLQSLRQSAPVGPFGLIARARADEERLKTVLESFGYYRSAVSIDIDGKKLEDPDLIGALNALPPGAQARVRVGFQLGPLYHLGRVQVEGELPAFAGNALGLGSGAPAVASTVLAAGRHLQSVLQDGGYAFARVDAPVAYEDAVEPLLDVVFHVEAGQAVPIGAIRFEGLRRMRESLLRSSLTVHTGQAFSAAALERARRELLALGPFAAVSVQLGSTVDATGGVPVTFKMQERRRHAVGINGAYSSDLGGSSGVTWTDRNLFGGAEQLAVAASVLNVGGNAATAVGYDTSVKLVKPNFLQHDQSLQLVVDAVKQSLQAYDQTAHSAALTLARKLSSVWSANAGVSVTDEQIVQDGLHNYTLLAVPVNLNYDSTDLASPLDDPTHGMRDSLSVAPTRALGHPNATFTISQVKLVGYLDLDRLLGTDPGRTVLALRLLAGLAQGAGELSLPPDQRFYGGGSGTIRGFRYQSVGPQFTSPPSLAGTPIGGTAIAAGSLELRQRIAAHWGTAWFIDAGQVSSSLKPLPDVLRVGAGAGLRYYTPIGPVRFDVAVPTKTYGPGQDRFEFYVGLGQAF